MEREMQIEFYPGAVPGVKSASGMTGREEAESIMKRIYNENPSYWPYGLDIPGHTDVFLIRDKMTKVACGFVGWQQDVQDGRRIGSYTIGILPEFRKQGYAKEAIEQVIEKKASECDEVRAYVVSTNEPSKALARSLGVNLKLKF